MKMAIVRVGVGAEKSGRVIISTGDTISTPAFECVIPCEVADAIEQERKDAKEVVQCHHNLQDRYGLLNAAKDRAEDARLAMARALEKERTRTASLEEDLKKAAQDHEAMFNRMNAELVEKDGALKKAKNLVEAVQRDHVNGIRSGEETIAHQRKVLAEQAKNIRSLGETIEAQRREINTLAAQDRLNRTIVQDKLAEIAQIEDVKFVVCVDGKQTIDFAKEAIILAMQGYRDRQPKPEPVVLPHRVQVKAGPFLFTGPTSDDVIEKMAAKVGDLHERNKRLSTERDGWRTQSFQRRVSPVVEAPATPIPPLKSTDALPVLRAHLNGTIKERNALRERVKLLEGKVRPAMRTLSDELNAALSKFKDSF